MTSKLTLRHHRFVLKNGLHVFVHPDDRLPLVTVNVLYRVGARHDPPGRTGVAHLFEHLMFMGTRRVPGGQFDLLMEQHGGSNNAFTSEDVTDYYCTGPARLLETLLWLEADRMATMGRDLTQKKLDLQRDVVLNERRQSYEEAPYGAAWLALPGLLFPAAHPYSWPVIGSAEDLRAVTVSDLKTLFAGCYSPKNAALVVAGQVDPDEVRGLVERYFGWIPAAPPIAPRRHRAPRLRRAVRQVIPDRVELPRLYLSWHSPAYLAPGDAAMDLAAAVLSTGKEARLHQALVHEHRLAVDVDAQQESRHLGGVFGVEVTTQPGADLQEVERVTVEILRQIATSPPTQEELERAKNTNEAHFVAGLERVSRRAELLNLYWAATGEPDQLSADLERYRKVTADDVRAWSARILDPQRQVTLWVVPEEEARRAS